MAEQRERYDAERASKRERPGTTVRPGWDEARLLALRRHLRMTQQELASELGVRQQTVSEWETGMYRPRGASVRLLGIVAERAGFDYRAGPSGGTPATSEDAR